MKTLEFLRKAMICIMGVFIVTACSDDDDNGNGNVASRTVPDAVLTAFNEDYSDVSNVDWDVEDGGFHVAEFVKGGKEYDVWYTASGTWVMTEIDHDRDLSALPQAVQEGYAATIYAQNNWTIDDIDEIRRPDYETIYKIEVEKNGQADHDLYFDVNGALFRDVEDQDDDRNSGLIQSSVPSAIATYIETNYPGAAIVDFEKEYNGYEVDIIYDGESKELLFDTDYTWVQTATDCLRNIPANIISAVNASYPGKVIDDCDYVETAAGETYYLVDLDDYDNDLKITLDGVITEVAG